MRGKARRRAVRVVDGAARAGACLLPAQPALMILSHVRALALGGRWPCRSPCTCCSPGGGWCSHSRLLLQALAERRAQRPAVGAKLLTPGVFVSSSQRATPDSHSRRKQARPVGRSLCALLSASQGLGSSRWGRIRVHHSTAGCPWPSRSAVSAEQCGRPSHVCVNVCLPWF